MAKKVSMATTSTKTITEPVKAVKEDVVTTESVVDTTKKDTVITEPVVDATKKEAVVTEEDTNPVSVYVNKLNNYVERITTMNKELKDLVNVGKSLEKDFNNIVKVLTKKNKNKSSERRHPSGFAVASVLSEEMYDFLGITKGEKVPRKDVTRMINDYITKNSLRDSKDKRIIKPNDELQKIFRNTADQTITYFNLQAFIKHHFIKENNNVVATVA